MEKSMSVQVKQSHIRKTASFLGPVLGVLAYGDKVSVVGDDNPDWIKVKAGAGSGFVHSSALTTKEVILNPGAQDVEKAASSDEIALAGKGFNDQVEGAFRAKNPHLNFAAIFCHAKGGFMHHIIFPSTRNFCTFLMSFKSLF